MPAKRMHIGFAAVVMASHWTEPQLVCSTVYVSRELAEARAGRYVARNGTTERAFAVEITAEWEPPRAG